MGSPQGRVQPRKMIFVPINDRMVDPEFDTDANDDEITGVGLDHLHQGNGFEIQMVS